MSQRLTGAAQHFPRFQQSRRYNWGGDNLNTAHNIITFSTESSMRSSVVYEQFTSTVHRKAHKCLTSIPSNECAAWEKRKKRAHYSA